MKPTFVLLRIFMNFTKNHFYFVEFMQVLKPTFCSKHGEEKLSLEHRKSFKHVSMLCRMLSEIEEMAQYEEDIEKQEGIFEEINKAMTFCNIKAGFY